LRKNFSEVNVAEIKRGRPRKDALGPDEIFEQGLPLNRNQASVLIKDMQLEGLSKALQKSPSGFLEIFFQAKTHKPNMPLRPIVSENGTWQKVLSSFLLKPLNFLEIDDPYMVKDSLSVVERLHDLHGKHVILFSADITDMFFNIDVNELVKVVQEAVIKIGLQVFRREFGIDDLQLLKLLRIYLSSTVAEFEDKRLRQKSGICIGSEIAPVLSNLFA